MDEELRKSDLNRSCNVSIVGLVADESRFGPLLEGKGSNCFNDDFVGRKSFALSARPSAAWIREFNKTFPQKAFLLQPNKKRIYVLVDNKQVWYVNARLTEEIDSINNNLCCDSMNSNLQEEVLNSDESNIEHMRIYLERQGLKKLPLLNNGGEITN
ncbi:hypothetical protein V4Z81_003192 [Klebsiella oxytoca]